MQLEGIDPVLCKEDISAHQFLLLIHTYHHPRRATEADQVRPIALWSMIN